MQFKLTRERVEDLKPGIVMDQLVSQLVFSVKDCFDVTMLRYSTSLGHAASILTAFEKQGYEWTITTLQETKEYECILSLIDQETDIMQQQAIAYSIYNPAHAICKAALLTKIAEDGYLLVDALKEEE